MQQRQKELAINPAEAAILTLILLACISYCIIVLELVPHVPVVFAIMGLFVYGMLKKVPVRSLEAGLTEGAKTGLGAIMIFFFIGLLISSWMASGTIPTFMYYSFELLSGKWFYAMTFVITTAIGLSIGSSLTTSATVGASFVAVAVAMGISPAITAGAVVSGAFFGDKMSPLSDTTTLASSTLKVDLFEHIKNMTWTTIPAFILSLVMFIFLSPDDPGAGFEKVSTIKQELVAMNLVHWYSLIPFFLLAALAIKKVPAIITLGLGTVSALLIALFISEPGKYNELLMSLFSGYKAETKVDEVASLLSRGGLESMMFSVSLVLLALSMGGLLFRLGIIPALLKGISRGLESTAVLFSSAAATSIGINFLLGEQYLSIILTANTYEDHFLKAGLHPKNLSRILEDAGTVVNPLVPWGVCGVFLTQVLGVPTIEYLPFAFFCLLSPIMTILAGITGKTVTRLTNRLE
ncbi:Na+/H+ antiporter NhaC [Bacillus massilinigeriensis]|uniref:Na+/H+ antiporter NhaC n=1 Tax=Bacillus mediterraneensis TaxID=1805474 RepID=UPI0008F7FFA9|nr:Na+/H+ antiporter NhaC [Bacillus mediterraneensis]